MRLAKQRLVGRSFQARSMTSRIRNLLVYLVLFGVVLAMFLLATSNGFVNYDDPQYVTENARVESGLTWENVGWAVRNGYASNWHPLTWLSHMLDCQLFGLKPWGHHLTNVLLHSANALLVFVVLRTLTGAIWRSLFVAALFALHPLRVQSVAWVAERKDVLSAFFFMLTLWAYVRFAEGGRGRGDGGGGESQSGARIYALALLFFALGLMSKPTVVTLPFVLLLLDYWPLNRFQTTASNSQGPGARKTGTLKHLVLEKTLFFALAGVASLITF